MEDEKIIDLLWDRQETALAEIQSKYGKACMNLSRNIVKSEQDAEECVNDAYLKIWQSIPPARPKSLLAYLLKITRNLSLNRREYNFAQKRADSDALPFDELENELHDLPISEDSSETLKELINSFLDSLSEADAALFVRRYWYMDSVSALSRMSGYSENNVYQKLHTLRKKMRHYFKKEGFTL